MKMPNKMNILNRPLHDGLNTPPCTVKPVCDDKGLVGVEDGCRRVSVALNPNEFSPEYSPLADRCTCEGENKFKTICEASPRQNPYFRPAKPAERNEPVMDADDDADDTDPTEDRMKEVGNTLAERMMEADEEGFITGSKIRINDDGTASLELGFISPQTGDAAAGTWDGSESLEGTWESVEQDQEYLEALAKQAKQFLPKGWSVSESSVSEIPIQMVDGRPVPLENEEGTIKLTLQPPTEDR